MSSLRIYDKTNIYIYKPLCESYVGFVFKGIKVSTLF
jgi:hypothetical protein